MNLNPNHLHQVPWYLPTLYGDIQLTAQGNQTEIEWENLSPSERVAMDALGKKYRVDVAHHSGKKTVDAPIHKVEPVLVKSMKRGRKLLSAVVFKGGRIEEIHRAETPYRTPAKSGVEAKELDEKPAAAVTVAQPTQGCPVPEFARADVRATRVLRAFLSPQQLADFDRTQSFLVTGADSGHQYLLTSRQAPRERLDKVGGRSVFDVNRGCPVCVHDWVVPAAEELLELALFLQMPGHEEYVVTLPPEPMPIVGGIA